MIWLLILTFLIGIYLSDAGYGSPYAASYTVAEAQSDVEAPSYVPSYLKHHEFSKSGYSGHYRGSKTSYMGTKSYGGGTKTIGTYGGGTKTIGSYGGGYGKSKYSEGQTWYSSSGQVPTMDDFYKSANSPYQPKCTPECQNSGICVDTNTCRCPPNYSGHYCEYERKPCLDHPPLPMNSRRRCSTDFCTISCMEGHKFPDGTSVANVQCVQGQWQPARAELAVVPDCEPECAPPCLNGGVCLARGVCNCPLEYRGPQCQYSASVCDARRMSFNGGYSCASHSTDSVRCTLSCPAGAAFSSPPAEHYTCHYSTGVFTPQPIPKCVFPDLVVISPHSHYYNETFYSISEGEGHQYSLSHVSHSGAGVVMDHTPRGGACLSWAGAHYKTFDGAVYTFQSPCRHILVRDPKDHQYIIAVKHGVCTRRPYCPSEITIYLDEKSYTLATDEEGSVVFRSGRRLLPMPAALPGIRVQMPADYVVVNLDAVGVTLKWDTNNVIQVEGSVLLWNNTEGLCGLLNGDPSDELVTRGVGTAAVAASWKLDKIGDICETSPTDTAACASETAEDVTKATKFCNDMISMSKFKKCSKVMNVLQFLEACKWDYCACTKTLSSEECACNAISVYAKECLRHGVEEMKNWRAPDICPMKCPDGKLYKSCGPDVQPSCASPLPGSAGDNSTCVEGCFCPEGLLLDGGKCLPKEQCPCRLRNKVFKPGHVLNKDCNTCTCALGSWSCSVTACGARCRAVGDPHYATFDGARYEFMGACSYTMLRTPGTIVTVHNQACSGAITEAMNLTPYKGSGRPSCTKAVSVEYGGADIQLQQGGRVSVNGREITELPVTVAEIIIRVASSLFVIVQLPNKVDVWWDGQTRVFIDVPPEFKGKTEGLCGTFNMNQADDFLTPEKDVEQSAVAFGNKWKTREFCTDSQVAEVEHPCKVNMENKEAAEKYCGILKSKVFEECHWYVDVESYYASCVYDMCACAGDVSRCLCPLLGDYAMMCAASGIKLQWRYNVKECELSCGGGQQYTVCADSCQRRCADTALAACRPQCVEGCACTPGQLLDDKNQCVPVAMCPCYHKGMQFDAGYKEVRAGRRETELCTCMGAKWECVPATPQDIQNYPPAEDLKSNCSAAANMEFTTCMKTEPVTCKNMHLPPAARGGVCRAGCSCRAGLVLDAAGARCVSPRACPCHHAGRAHAHGDTVRDRCNTCECKNGNWTCTTNVCPGICSAWGDSHIMTFDGNAYDFEGVCTYLLAKGSVDGSNGFAIEIQNVPCGTTGATCSKSITLKVGDEVVVLTRDAPLPDVALLKRINLREAGVYVFLDVPSLGVTLQWDRQLRVYVKLDTAWQGRVRGLCGNYNGDMRDDFQTPSSGNLAEASPLIFADSWKTKPTCPKAQPVTDHCATRQERRAWSQTTCDVLTRSPFAACHAEVPVEPYIERCRRDACACDAGGDCACACAALAEYAYQCARHDVRLRWRTKDLCPMQCDEECSAYDACVSPCPVETCDNVKDYEALKTVCDKDDCVEGCKRKKPCPAGSVYKNSSSSECVSRAACRPCVAAGGAEVPAGGVVSQDACHTCRCDRGEVVCAGQPCTSTTELEDEETSTPMEDSPLSCQSGWTPWVSSAPPETADGHSREVEPLPTPQELVIGLPMCAPEKMKTIECRTVDAHLSPKDTGLDVECSLERGLVCSADGVQCPDFEVRVYCQCEDVNPCENVTLATVTAHSWDCRKYVECGAAGAVEKPCSPATMFNPHTLVCDWPDNVIKLRPECGTYTSSTAAPTTHSTTPSTQPTTKPTTSTPVPRTTHLPVPTGAHSTTHNPRCAPNQVYKDCVYPCDKMCDHFKKTLLSKGKCHTEACVGGCVDEDKPHMECAYASYWRDEKTCVPKKDCTCYSEEGIVKPGGVVEDGCLKCQCLDNVFHCDSSECVSIVVPYQGSTHEPIIIPHVINPPSFTPSTTTSTTTISPTTSSTTTEIIIVDDTTTDSTPTETSESTGTTTTVTPSTVTSSTVTPTTVTPTTVTTTTVTTPTIPPTVGTPSTPSTPSIPLIVTTIITPSTATPPPECSPDQYYPLLWGDNPVPESSFTASSQINEKYAPKNSKFYGSYNSHSAGGWSPAVSDVNQYIQVELPEKLPVHGLEVQGSAHRDHYVTSYELLYGDDGHVFHPVGGANAPRVFRGPIDHFLPQKQMISPPLEAKFVRLRPLTWHDQIAVRFELIGCKEPVTETEAEYYTTPEPMQCTEPLGVAGDLPLDAITVSSNPDDKKYLDVDGDRGWRPLYSTPGEWVMFNFTSPRNITGVKTKGGDKGWVTAYKVLYTNDLETYNKIIDKDGTERIYPANFDKDSEMSVEFRPPLHAQYLKILPMKWKNNIEMRIEPIGCYKPYPASPSPSPEIPTESTTASTGECSLCAGVDGTDVTCACAAPLHYDGEDCVPRAQCPCIVGFMTYPVGSTFRGEACDECVCKLGGVPVCTPVRECKCDNTTGNIKNSVPKLDKKTCSCACWPCPSGTLACSSGVCLPEDKWCDGLQDCPEDELGCPRDTTTPTTPSTSTTPTTPAALTTQTAVTVAVTQPTTTAKPLECPVVQCPPGYKVYYTTSRPRTTWYSSDLPPPRPRYSYQRYHKGGFSKGGFSKGGFSKGGFSKGGYSKGGFSGISSQDTFTLAQPSAPARAGGAPAAPCPQFKCVPHVPPFPRDGSTPPPVVCSVVHCPPGYTVRMEPTKSSFSKCPVYDCVPIVEQPTWCNMTGRTFNTFDGAEYKYDVCFHILARENHLNSWTVLVRKKCRNEGCWNELLVHQDNELIIVKPDLMIEYNNYQYTVEQTNEICFKRNSFQVERLGDGVLVRSKRYNFTVLYNKEGDAKIGVLKTHLGRVDGLCGAYDGSRYTDRRLPDGRMSTTLEQFGRAWARPGLEPHACAPRVVNKDKQHRVWELCDVITKEPLSRCGAVLDVHKWRGICLEKVCACSAGDGARSERECRCALLQQLVAECVAAGGAEPDLAGWRLLMDCPASCPAPLVHHDCYRGGEPRCVEGGVPAGGVPAGSAGAEGGACFPGCYCPAGLLRKGDDCVPPHDCNDCSCTGVGSPAKYETFEGDDLPSLGNCTYLVSRDNNRTGQHQYQVFATNGPCEDKPALVCTQAVHLMYDKHVLHITKNPESDKITTTINKRPVFKYPLIEEWGAVRLENAQDIIVTLTHVHLQLKVFQKNMKFSVQLPSAVFANRTEGLCGVCAGGLDALLTANHTTTDNVDEFGKSWQASPSALTALDVPPAQCDEPPPPPPCKPAPDSLCNYMLDVDRFGKCHPLEDPVPLVAACAAEACAGGAACDALDQYAALCRRRGVCLHWRHGICPYQCEAPLVYTPCMQCDRSCNDTAPCDKNTLPLEGCFCPEGKVRVNNTCIEPSKCFPCDADNQHYAGDEWQEDACTTCSCAVVSGAARTSCVSRACAPPPCAAPLRLRTLPAPPAACCPTYICEEEPKKNCSEPKRMECGYGQELKQKTIEGCTEYSCECIPASSCPPLSAEPPAPGVAVSVDTSGCCPVTRAVCLPASCPPAAACPPLHDLITTNIIGQCCPNYTCELPKDKCVVKLEWEGSQKGGEQARKEPELVLKEVGARWPDGPCRVCECGEAAGGAAPHCRVTSCAAPAAPGRVLRAEPEPFQCCPRYVQVACRDADNIYKVGENWTLPNEPCTEYRCVEVEDGKLEKVTAVQQCDDNCQPGWEYSAPPDNSTCCGSCTPVACVADGQLRAVGSTWVSPDHCVHYTCVNHNGTLQVQSSNETCPEVPEYTRKLYVVNEKKIEGKCCPEHEVVACRDGDKIYQEGQSWQSDSPCVSITCARGAGGLAAAPALHTCAPCPRGHAAAPPNGTCCGACEQTHCVLGDQLYDEGSTWSSPDNCTQWKCTRMDGQLFVTSSRAACPDVSACAPDYLVNGTCCQTCEEPPESLSKCVPKSVPREKTIGMIRVRVHPHGECANTAPLDGFSECQGNCDSKATYNTLVGTHETQCECCSPVRYTSLQTELVCEDGSRRAHRVGSPKACACTPCGAARPHKFFVKGKSEKMMFSTRRPPPTTPESDEIPQIYQRFGEFND